MTLLRSPSLIPPFGSCVDGGRKRNFSRISVVFSKWATGTIIRVLKFPPPPSRSPSSRGRLVNSLKAKLTHVPHPSPGRAFFFFFCSSSLGAVPAASGCRTAPPPFVQRPNACRYGDMVTGVCLAKDQSNIVRYQSNIVRYRALCSFVPLSNPLVSCPQPQQHPDDFVFFCLVLSRSG